MNPTFLNEHLLPGQLGHLCVLVMLVASLFAAFSFARSAALETVNPAESHTWRQIGRWGYAIHMVCIIGIFTALYYIITRHRFEYNYAYQHSSRALPMKYLLSSFWEGQEGSFLLWAFWQGVLGFFLMRPKAVLETRALTVVSIVQAALATMLLGIYLSPEARIGTTPFILLRDQMHDAPIFALPNYLQFIEDGNGLNELLQNYWMVIHPPVLFLGFASTLMPFALVLATLWKGEYTSWVAPARRWALWAGGALGLGIMMGGAWAYESLTFGGYWAWDPVENASLVPWLLLVAGLHTTIIYNATRRSIAVSFIFLLLTYIMVWYSTFLTRTGILGDTSVHAFTGEGSSLSYHILAVIGLLVLAAVVLLIKRWRVMPKVRTEEAVATREFWMFIGSFVLLLSAGHIIMVTSVPVWAPLAKWISGKDIAPPVDPVAHYNSIQVWVGLVVALLAGSTLFLKFKTTNMRQVSVRLGLTALLAAVLTLVVAITQRIVAPQYILLLFASVFAFTASLVYMIQRRNRFIKNGAAITHLGFALMLLGILLSSYNKEVISINTLGVVMDFGRKTQMENVKESQENVILFRNTPVALGEYQATYLGDSTSPTDPRRFYKVHYERIHDGKLVETFTLYPDAFINPKGQQGIIANPDSKHYLHKDIFTYVTQALDPERVKDTARYIADTLSVGDTTFFNSGYFVFRGFDRGPKKVQLQPEDLAVGANLEVHGLTGATGKTLSPVFIIRGEEVVQEEDTLREAGLHVRLANILPQTEQAVIEYKQRQATDDYIVLKAIVFPFINLLWLGIVIMTGGFIISMVNRSRKKAAVTRATIPEDRVA